jgi:hypothetical protein
VRGREGEVGPALRAGNRVHLVEDDRVDSPERLTPSRSKDAAAPGRVRLDRRGVQLIEGPEECGEGLAAAGGRGVEPGLGGRSEACGHARHGKSPAECQRPARLHRIRGCRYVVTIC